MYGFSATELRALALHKTTEVNDEQKSSQAIYCQTTTADRRLIPLGRHVVTSISGGHQIHNFSFSKLSDNSPYPCTGTEILTSVKVCMQIMCNAKYVQE